MMKKKGEFPLIGAIIVSILGLIMISVIWGMFTSATNYETQTDTWTNTGIVPTNISLSKSPGISLISLKNTTGYTIPASNYTNAVTSGYVTILDNGTSWGNTNVLVNYNYQQVGYITSGITKVVLGFIALFLAVALLLIFIRKDGD